MRWVILTDDHPPQLGGVATWTAWASQALAEHHEVRVFARARPGLPAEVTAVHGLRGRWGPWFTASRAVRALRRADAVLCTTWPLVPPLVGLRKPIHVVAHGSEVTRPHRGRFHRAWGLATHRWAVSSFLVDRLRMRGVAAMRLPVPVQRLHSGGGGSRWLFVGRAVHGKGGDRFVRLVAASGAAGDLVGEGPALEGWRRLAQDLGARVRFHGALDREACGALMDRAAVVALLSRPEPDGSGAEGLGLVLLEARARGIPVIGSAVGGVPEAVGRGLVLEQPDDVEGCAARVVDWLPNAGANPNTDAPEAFLEALCRS